MISTPPVVASLAQRPGARQFVKFCIVGASSAIIDFGLLGFFYYRMNFPVYVAATLSFFCAVCNGFYWNRRWTFRAGEGDAKRQYPKFVLTNIIGWMLNLSIMTGILILAGTMGLVHTKRSAMEVINLILIPGGHGRAFHPLALYGAKAVATVFVTAWNFTASKFWTFKQV